MGEVLTQEWLFGIYPNAIVFRGWGSNYDSHVK